MQLAEYFEINIFFEPVFFSGVFEFCVREEGRIPKSAGQVDGWGMWLRLAHQDDSVVLVEGEAVDDNVIRNKHTDFS